MHGGAGGRKPRRERDVLVLPPGVEAGKDALFALACATHAHLLDGSHVGRYGHEVRYDERSCEEREEPGANKTQQSVSKRYGHGNNMGMGRTHRAAIATCWPSSL